MQPTCHQKSKRRIVASQFCLAESIRFFDKVLEKSKKIDIVDGSLIKQIIGVMSCLYESVFVFRQELTTSEVNKNIDQLIQIVQDNGGKLLKNEYWGLRTLAYTIKKNKKGHYVMLILDTSAQALEEIKNKVSLSTDIIRDQIVRIEEFDGKDSIMLSSQEKW